MVTNLLGSTMAMRRISTVPLQQDNYEQIVTRMNQDAVLRVLEGNSEEAKVLLSDCLNHATSWVARAAPGQNPSVCIIEVPLVGALGPEDDWHGYTGRFFQLYRYVFHASIADDTKVPWDAPTAVLFCATATYNLAIVYHHDGMIEGDTSALGQARSLYSNSLRFLSRELESGDSNANLLAMALYNNLGHLLSFLDDRSGVLQCRMELQNRLDRANVNDATATFFRHSLSTRPTTGDGAAA